MEARVVGLTEVAAHQLVPGQGSRLVERRGDLFEQLRERHHTEGIGPQVIRRCNVVLGHRPPERGTVLPDAIADNFIDEDHNALALTKGMIDGAAKLDFVLSDHPTRRIDE